MQKEASLFKILSDPTRLRLASILLSNGETCVCALAQAINEPDCKVSRHLGIMRSVGLVETRREGTWIYYKLVAPRTNFEHTFQKFLRKGLEDHPTLAQDLSRLSGAVCS